MLHILILAIYLTVTICISAVSMVVQMIILNIYHKAPLSPVPTWLKRAQQISTCPHGIMPVADISNGLEEESTKENPNMAKSADKTPAKASASDRNGDPVEICDESNETAEESLRQEWQMVARMMDKIFFIVFLLLQLSLIIGIISIIPWSWVD